MRQDNPAILPLIRALALGMLVPLVVASACRTEESAPSAGGAARASEAAEFAGYVRVPALDVSGVMLPDTYGSEVRMVAQSNGLRIVFFGYTTCPDVCPMTLGFIKSALASMSPADQSRVNVDMITVDPARDTAEKMAEYVHQFVPDATALRTEDPTLLRATAKAFGADFDVQVNTEGEVEVSHTGDLYVVDDSSAVVLAWPFGTAAADIERDLKRLLAGHRPK